LRPYVAITLLAAALSAAGCGSKARESAVADYSRVRAMGDFYSGFFAENRGQPPKDEQAFRDYLNTKQEQLKKAGLTVDDMFKSPRAEGPLVWVYGKRAPVGSSGISYVGYEKIPIANKRLVIGTRGVYEQLDEAQFRKVFPNAS
jgi:hypothetical protein